ncbi:MAG TPA: hypothetical protein VGM37_01555 [Armatimonadota bacterium]|jgi:hypothetical protein
MKKHTRKHWLLPAAICAAIGIAGWQLKSSGSGRSGVSPGQGDDLALHLLSLGVQRGREDAHVGLDKRREVFDAPTAWLMLPFTEPSEAAFKKTKTALDAQSPQMGELYMRVFADGYVLGFVRVKGVPAQPNRRRVQATDEEWFRYLAEVLKTSIRLSNGILPSAQDLEEHAIILDKPATSTSPAKSKPYHSNPNLAGRRYASIRHRQDIVAYYEDPPAPDGKRWVLLLDLKTVKRIDAAEWLRLKTASGIH